MVKPECQLEKIVIVTKEVGKIIFTDEFKWKSFKLQDYTLHSLKEPAFQEYYIGGSTRFVWFCNGKHHRSDGPAIYSFNRNTISNHKFDLKNIKQMEHFEGYYDYNDNDALNVYFYLNSVSYGQMLSKKYLSDIKIYSRSSKIKSIFQDEEL
jgi:hypothetical protein